MYRELSHLLLFSDLKEDEILVQLAAVFQDWDAHNYRTKEELVGRIYGQIKRLLDLATACGFDENLWQCYLTWLLMTNENSFTRTCERIGASDGSVNHFARGDFAVFHRLMHFDFSPIESDLGIDCFSMVLRNDQVAANMYNLVAALEQICGENSVKIRENISLVAAVGCRAEGGRAAVYSKMLETLAANEIRIRIITQGPEEANLVIGVDDKHCDDAIRVLYQAFVG